MRKMIAFVVALACAALQQQPGRIDPDVRDRLDAQQQQIDALKARIETLEAARPTQPTSAPSLADLRYLGCFALQAPAPKYDGDLKSKIRLSGSPGTISYDGESLWCCSHAYSDLIAPFAIPDGWQGATTDTKPTAQQAGPWQDFSGGKFAAMIDANGKPIGARVIGGYIKVAGKWAWTGREYYNGDASDDPCFGYDSGAAVKVEPMSLRTATHLQYLDGQMFCGATGFAIQGPQSHGPILYSFAFDPSKGVTGDYTATELCFYPLDSPHESWNNCTDIVGFVHTGTAVYQFGTHGLGEVWYGQPTSDSGKTDPCDRSKGYHCEGREVYCWVLDPAQNYKCVAFGPIMKLLGLSGDCNYIRGVAFDATNKRIFLTMDDPQAAGTEPVPMVHVLGVN